MLRLVESPEDMFSGDAAQLYPAYDINNIYHKCEKFYLAVNVVILYVTTPQHHEKPYVLYI